MTQRSSTLWLKTLLTFRQFSDVLRYMTYAAVGTSVPGVLLSWFLPDHTLPCALTIAPLVNPC